MKNTIKPATKRLREMKLNQELAWKVFKEQRTQPLAQSEKQAFLSALRGYAEDEALAEAAFISEVR